MRHEVDRDLITATGLSALDWAVVGMNPSKKTVRLLTEHGFICNPAGWKDGLEKQKLNGKAVQRESQKILDFLSVKFPRKQADLRAQALHRLLEESSARDIEEDLLAFEENLEKFASWMEEYSQKSFFKLDNNLEYDVSIASMRDRINLYKVGKSQATSSKRRKIQPGDEVVHIVLDDSE